MPQPGFHVVEVESPRLGKALLDRDAPMFVRTSVLVTNLGVHFKWGAVNSGVWVTTLDKAKPVSAAQIQVSDCRGKAVWKGQTNKQGFAQIDEELPSLPWNYCERGGVSREDGYFISARKTDEQGRADMAFVWSNWNEGIESWRFHVNTTSHDETERERFHTIMDRTLLRAGQTVSMKHLARTEVGAGLRDADRAERADAGAHRRWLCRVGHARDRRVRGAHRVAHGRFDQHGVGLVVLFVVSQQLHLGHHLGPL